MPDMLICFFLKAGRRNMPVMTGMWRSMVAAWSLALLLPAAAAGQDAAPPVRPAGPDTAFGTTLGEAGEDLKTQELMNRMSVAVSVNGHGPFRFVIDSGADRSVIGGALAERLSLPPGRSVTLHSMAGARKVDTVRLRSLTVGSNTIEGINAPALREEHIGAQGLLGVDALANQRVTLDFDRKLMTVQGGRAPPVDDDEIIVTARRRFGQLILAEADIDKDRIYAIVDTGSTVTIGNSALHDKVFAKRRKPPPTVPITLISVTGESTVADLAILPQIRIGGLLMRNVPVAFSDTPPFALFGVDKAPAMLIGTDVLQYFRRVLLDFRDKKVRFQLRKEPMSLVWRD